MGREIKRVAAGFDWPLGKVWQGFINPHYKKCPQANITCFGGSTAAERWMDAICRFLALVGEECAAAPHAEQFKERGRIYPHPYLEEFAQAPRYDIPPEIEAEAKKIEDSKRQMQFLYRYANQHPAKLIPLTDELLYVLGRFARTKDFDMGGSASWEIQKAIFAGAGIDRELSKFGVCKVCDGEGLDPDVKEVYDAWEQTPIPNGSWWQVWETVSEGSPVTPAFATDAELIDYLVVNGDARDQKRGDGGWSRENAEKFVSVGWAPSAMVVSGPEGAAMHTPRDGGI